MEGERRTLVRHIQVARRESGLAIQDRISLWLAPEVLAHANLIVEEVLATSVGPLPCDDPVEAARSVRSRTRRPMYW